MRKLLKKSARTRGEKRSFAEKRKREVRAKRNGRQESLKNFSRREKSARKGTGGKPKRLANPKKRKRKAFCVGRLKRVRKINAEN